MRMMLSRKKSPFGIQAAAAGLAQEFLPIISVLMIWRLKYNQQQIRLIKVPTNGPLRLKMSDIAPPAIAKIKQETGTANLVL
jgi:uncharacterized spore protein YtfJ